MDVQMLAPGFVIYLQMVYIYAYYTEFNLVTHSSCFDEMARIKSYQIR